MTQAVEACRLIDCNQKELRRSQNFNTSSTGRGKVSRGNSSRKREAPWSNYQRESKMPFQTEQQNNSRMSESRLCPNCGRYHPGIDCVGRRICYNCQKPGHMSWNCPEKAAELRPQNPGRMYALTST
ncbi:hypothetical protein K1719_012133 [Acacia pycnantha]|nr:hypothetical protein K1719_012133 [Acacia pycnantha]